MILGIETATALLGAALVHEGIILRSALQERPNAHDELLAPLCRDLLREHGIEPRQLNGVAVSAGPGSFTGLRIGMAVAKGMALALDIPLASVPTLDALAFAASRALDTTEEKLLSVVLAARQNEVYIARYAVTRGHWDAVNPVSVMKLREAAEAVRDTSYIAGIAPDLLQLLERLAGPEQLQHVTVHPVHIAQLGEEMIARGQAADLDSCEPLYVQEFEVKQAKHALFRVKE